MLVHHLKLKDESRPEGSNIVANRTKIVDASEVRRWIREGKTYQWMKEEYLRKYNIEISVSTFIMFNRKYGLSYRYAVLERGGERPWKVKEEHRSRGMDAYLSALIRRDNGYSVPEEKLTSAENWWKQMEERGLVVGYNPDSEEGFFAIPRRPGIDNGYVREPLN